MQPQTQQYCKLGLTTLFIIGGTITNPSAFAQLTPDNTLITESSIVNQIDLSKDRIEGGATRGINLFHSFQEFNVDAGKSVYFANPIGIDNILTRVTGANVSNILGKLGVEGTANLFLINPHGIYFGNGASLDIKGSFTATTADSIKLGEDGLFSASNPQSSNLLNVQPGALFVNALVNQQVIIKNEGNLTVDDGQNITLFGANVINTGTLTAPGGTVQFTVAENLQVRGNIETDTLLIDTKNLTIGEDDNATIDKKTLEGLSRNTNLIFQASNDITIHPLSANNLSLADGSGNITFIADADGNGIGNFQINTADTITANGRNIEIKGVNLTVGNINTSSKLGGGNINLTAQGDITTQNLNSSSFSGLGTGGTGGNITLSATGGNITTQSLYSFSFSGLGLGTGGTGGNITLSATGGNITTQDLNSFSFSSLKIAGNGGDITLTTNEGNISTQNLYSYSYSFVGTAGNGGGMTLTAGGDIKGIKDYKDEFPVFSSFSVSRTGNSGRGGNVTLAAKNNITDLDILTLSSSSKSGDVQINGFSDLSLTNTAIITSKQLTIKILGQEIILNVGGVGQSGNVNITSTGNLSFNNARIESDTKGDNPAGNVNITSPGIVTFNNSKIVSNTSSTGNAGNILIDADDLTLTSNSEISASTIAEGKAGDITLNTPTLTVANGAEIFATTKGKGDGGTIAINADKAVNLGIGVQDSSPILSVETSGAGKAGNIIVNTPSLTVSDTARITATATATATNKDGGGSITLNASKMNLAGTVGVFAETQGQAPAGTLKLNPYENQPDLDITLFPGSIISASTKASGKGGDLIITAPENINITGQGILAVESKGTGDAGNIQITTQNLTLSDGVKISASTFSSGKGGNIIVMVRDNITLDGTNTGLFASTEKGSIGDSGSIDIDPKIFIIKNGAGIGVNSQGTGKGGNISIQAGTLNLNNKAFINAETASSQGGNIDLNLQDLLLMRNNSKITATAGTSNAGGNGGNININAPFVVAVPSENNDITANAYQGNGGNINITTNQIFGLKYRPQLTSLSDITASSDFGVSGNVEITTPGLDPTSGLTNLPTSLLDVESLNKDICAIKDDKIAGGSSFVITGKGGLPLDSHELISNSPAFVEWENNSEVVTQVSNSPVKVTQKNTNHPQKIQQAQGWIIGENGKVILTDDSQKVTLQTDKNNLPDCK